jgi:hypothetical protein
MRASDTTLISRFVRNVSAFERIFFDRVVVSDRRRPHGEAQETSSGIAFVSEKADTVEAPDNCQTADDCKTDYCHQAPDKSQTSRGGEAATAY